MLIANPIYDVVFKYLMEDSKVAKIFLSAIIGQEILELDFKPQELSGELETVPKRVIKEDNFIPHLTVYRLDFSAKILTEEGEKIVIIEIQKAKLLNDVMRFRRYLGKQYQNPDYFYLRKSTHGKDIKYGFPIISIYFLGERLEHIHGIPVVMVNNEAIDLYSGKKIEQREDFVESLTHKSYIISIPDLSAKRRNELEILLSIFDQSSIDASHHILNVKEEDFAEKYRPIIRRLQKAASEQAMRNKMQLEDDFVSELTDYERMIEDARKKAEEAQQAAEEEKRRAEEEKRRAEEEKRRAEEASKQAQEAKQQQEQLKRNMVKNCFKKGMNTDEIAEITGISIEEIERIIQV
jgi:flagellar biosynthesis GTPase FlhF